MGNESHIALNSRFTDLEKQYQIVAQLNSHQGESVTELDTKVQSIDNEVVEQVQVLREDRNKVIGEHSQQIKLFNSFNDGIRNELAEKEEIRQSETSAVAEEFTLLNEKYIREIEVKCDISSDLSNKCNDMSILVSDAEALREQCLANEDRLKEQENNIVDLTNKADDLVTQLDNKTAEAESLSQRLHQFEDESSALERDMSLEQQLLKDTISKKEDEIADLIESMDAKSATIDFYTQTENATRKILEEREEENANLKLINEQLQNHIEFG